MTSTRNVDPCTGDCMDVGGPSDDCDSALPLWSTPSETVVMPSTYCVHSMDTFMSTWVLMKSDKTDTRYSWPHDWSQTVAGMQGCQRIPPTACEEHTMNWE